jgi:hypothetical protein
VIPTLILKAINYFKSNIYYKQFGFWHIFRHDTRRWFRKLFRICPDCGKPLWWKPNNHRECFPF